MLLALVVGSLLCLSEAPAGGNEWMVSMRDAFPIFDHPPMLSAADAESGGAILPRDVVIGVSFNGESRAYPIAVMGVHELGNDTVGGVPIAVTW